MNIENESFVTASKDEPLKVKFKNVTATFAEKSEAKSLISANSTYTEIINE